MNEKKQVDLIDALTTDADRNTNMSTDTERVILGELLFASYLHENVSRLKGHHFLSARYGKAWDIMKALAERNALDIPAARAEFTKQKVNILDEEINDWIVRSTNATKIEEHKNIIIDCHERRLIAETCNQAIANVYTGDLSQIKSTLEKSLENCDSSRLQAFTTKEVINNNRQHSNLTPISTGYKRLDVLLGGGISRQSMTTIAAPTGVGKSQKAVNISIKSKVDGKPARVLFICQEMGEGELEDRFISAIAGLKIGICRALRTGTASHETIDTHSRLYMQGLDSFQKLPIKIVAQGSITVSDLKNLVSRHRKDIDLIVLDYLQQCAVENSRQSIREHINEISRTCKQIATRYSIPVISIAQLNRQANSEDRPKLWHLKESSQIEQDSDYVILLYREKAEGATKENLEVNLAKNRHGMLGTLNFTYLLDCGVIADTNEGQYGQ